MNKATLFMTLSWIGLATFLAAMVLSLSPVHQGVAIFTAFIAVGCCWGLMFTRNADEYTSGLWTSAASFAFGAVLILFFGLPFLEGAYDGLMANERHQDVGAEVTIGCAMMAFYIGLFWKRFRGDA